MGHTVYRSASIIIHLGTNKYVSILTEPDSKCQKDINNSTLLKWNTYFYFQTTGFPNIQM